MKKYFPFKNQAELLSQSFLKQLPDNLNTIKSLWEKLSLENTVNSEAWQNYQNIIYSITEVSGTFGFKKVSERARNLYLLAKNIVAKETIENADRDNMKYLISTLIAQINNEMLIIREQEREAIEVDPVNFNNHEGVFVLELGDSESSIAEVFENFAFKTKIFKSIPELVITINNCIPISIVIHYSDTIDEDEIVKITKHDMVKSFNLPIIFIIDQVDFSKQLKIAKLGGNLVITKPLNTDDLQLAINELSPLIKTPPKILIVDDDIACLTFYALELKRFGMEVDAVTDYEQTLDSLTTFLPDIILMDLYLTGTDGIQISAEIRKMDKYKNIPIIFISGETETAKQFEAMRYGDDFVSKPVNISTLVRLLRAWLELKEDSIQNTSVRLSHNKLLKKIDIDHQNIQKAKSTVFDLQAKIKELEKEIDHIKDIPSNSELESGTVLPGINGSYMVERVLSFGGMGTVYTGKQNSTNEKVVVKVLSPEYMASVKDTMRFLQEAQIIMKLNHPNLVKGYDYFQCQKLCYLVMEFIDGKEVMEILEKRKTIDPIFALEIALDIAKAFSYMEKIGIVHRDIKPENILIDRNNIAKLIDFGILKMINNPCSLTTRGIILGTPFYISPEQIYQNKIDIRSDIYSLGATLFHMITGRLPFQGDNPIDIMQQRLFRTPIINEIDPKVPLLVSELVEKMMAKEIQNRYSCAEELIIDIEKALEKIKTDHE